MIVMKLVVNVFIALSILECVILANGLSTVRGPYIVLSNSDDQHVAYRCVSSGGITDGAWWNINGRNGHNQPYTSQSNVTRIVIAREILENHTHIECCFHYVTEGQLSRACNGTLYKEYVPPTVTMTTVTVNTDNNELESDADTAATEKSVTSSDTSHNNLSRDNAVIPSAIVATLLYWHLS